MVKITNIGFTNITMQQRKDGSIQKMYIEWTLFKL
ncbi:hypothetical protein KSF78_0000737 [Schistosoma japonicum]|nr:hypothetical protein KSF78_0000737 [Schistosoma japonicum]